MNQIGQCGASFPAMAGIVLGFPLQCQARRQFKGFFQLDSRTAIGIDPGARFQVKRQQIAKAQNGPVLFEFTTDTVEVDAGKELEKPVDVAIPGEEGFPLALLHPLPPPLPGRGDDVAGVGKPEIALGHVAQDVGLPPGIPGLMGEAGPKGGELRVDGKALVLNDPGHAVLHVIKQVAVKKPIARLVGVEFDDRRGHGGHIDGVLERGIVALPVDHAEEVAVQVDRMVHHGPVDQDEPDDLAFADPDRIALVERPVVEKPDIALHVAVKGEADFTDWFVLGKSGTLRGPQFVVGRPGARIGAIHGKVLRRGDIGGKKTKIGAVSLAGPRTLRGCHQAMANVGNFLGEGTGAATVWPLWCYGPLLLLGRAGCVA